MNILIINNGTKNIEYLENLLQGSNITVVKNTEIPKDLQYDLIVLSGGSGENTLSVNLKSKNFDRERELIQTTNIPIVGICYGCELIADVFNCKIEEKEKVVGIVPIEILKDHEIFNGVYEFEAYESHRFNITELSAEVEAFARSEHGYEIIKHRNKNIWGFQFHPEKYLDESTGDEIFLNLIEYINILNIKNS